MWVALMTGLPASLRPPLEHMSSPERIRIELALRHRAGSDSDASATAHAVVALWGEIDRALLPIIGAAGVTALYGRSLFLAGHAHPWLSVWQQRSAASVDLKLLQSSVAAQIPSDAFAGACTFFVTFHDLLASMVGAALTERLLHSVWEFPTGGDPAQEPLQ